MRGLQLAVWGVDNREAAGAHRSDHRLGIVLVEVCQGKQTRQHIRRTEKDDDSRLVPFVQYIPPLEYDASGQEREWVDRS